VTPHPPGVLIRATLAYVQQREGCRNGGWTSARPGKPGAAARHGTEGVFALWSAPRGTERPELSRLELLALCTSVAEWRRHSGPAMLYCDEPYARYLESLGLIGLWDNVDVSLFASMGSLDVDPAAYFSLARIHAVGAARIPFASIDCDLIVWRSLAREFETQGVVFTHWESTWPSVWYPPPHELRTPDGYTLDPRRNWTLNAANSSVLYFGAEAARVRDAYVEEATRFIVGNPGRSHYEVGLARELLFAEQRLIPVIAREHGLRPTPIINAVHSPLAGEFVTNDPRYGVWNNLHILNQPTGITHLWYHKRWRGDLRLLGVERILTARLKSDHPHVADMVYRACAAMDSAHPGKVGRTFSAPGR